MSPKIRVSHGTNKDSPVFRVLTQERTQGFPVSRFCDSEQCKETQASGRTLIHFKLFILQSHEHGGRDVVQI